MKPRNEEKKKRFKIEKLEERIAPGTLTIRPHGVVDPSHDYVVPDAARPGLEAAQAHTGGVITWTAGE